MDDLWGDEAELDVVIEDPRWDGMDLPALAQRAFAATLDHLGLNADDWGASVMGCDDAQIAELNAEFRGKPTPTNVLSWPSDDRAADNAGERPAPPDPQDAHLGDIAIAFDTCQREAAAGGISPADHVTHLLVHGVLHLLGYDHIDDADAELMEETEIQILANLGIADPYKTGLG